MLGELQEKVLEYTDVESLNNLSVCSSSYTELCRPFLWRNVKIPPRYMNEYTPILHVQLPRLPRLEKFMEKLDTGHFQHTKSLRLTDDDTDDDFFCPVFMNKDSLLENTRKLLAKCNHLSVLHICYSLPVELWEGLDHLREVCLSYEAATNECVVALSNAQPHLRSLTIKERFSYATITSAGFAHIAACLPDLVELCLDGCKHLDDTCVKMVSGLGSLKRLYMRHCYGITTRGLPYIFAATGKGGYYALYTDEGKARDGNKKDVGPCEIH